MNLQYLSDSNGFTTGVFIPIHDWDEMQKVLPDEFKIEQSIHLEQIDIVKKRMEAYHNNPTLAIDFDTALAEIENQL